MTNEIVIAARDLNFSYDRNNLVLENVTFDILRNEFAAVIGPNGGGKTTLLKLVLGLLEPACGTIRVFGARAPAVRRRIAAWPCGTSLSLRRTNYPGGHSLTREICLPVLGNYFFHYKAPIGLVQISCNTKNGSLQKFVKVRVFPAGALQFHPSL